MQADKAGIAQNKATPLETSKQVPSVRAIAVVRFSTVAIAVVGKFVFHQLSAPSGNHMVTNEQLIAIRSWSPILLS